MTRLLRLVVPPAFAVISALALWGGGLGGGVLAAADPMADLQARVTEARAALDSGEAERAVSILNDALATVEALAGPDHPVVGFVLDQLAVAEVEAVDPQGAIAAAERAVAIFDGHGIKTPDTAIVIGNLGRAYALAGEINAAISAYRRSLEELKATVGPDDLRLAVVHRNLAIALQERGDEATALSHARRVVDLYAPGRDQEPVPYAEALLAVASLEAAEGEVARAGERVATVQAMAQAGELGPAVHAEAWLAAAAFAFDQSDFETVAAALSNAAAAVDDPRGDRNLTFVAGRIAAEKGRLAFMRGRFAEADSAYREGLVRYREAVGAHHPAVARALHGLAVVQQGLGLGEEADALFDQAIAIREDLGGPDDLGALASRLERAVLLVEQDQFDEAAAAATEVLLRLERAHPDRVFRLGIAHGLLGYAELERDNMEAAAAPLAEAIRLIEMARGPMSSDLPPPLLRLAEVRLAQGALDEALSLSARAVAIRERDGAVSAWGLSRSLAILATVQATAGETEEALAAFERATQIATEQAVSGADTDERGRAAMLREREVFERYAALLHELAPERPELLDRLVEVVQLPHLTGTAQGLREATAGLRSDDPKIGALVAERRRAVETARASELRVLAALQDDTRAARRQELKDEADAAKEALAILNAALQTNYPEVAEFLVPRPVSRASLQASLVPGEAVFLHLAGQNGSIYVLITHELVVSRRSSLAPHDLQALVERIRYGVTNEKDPEVRARFFDVEAGHELYLESLGLVAEHLRGVDEIFVVADGALQNVPLSLLLTEPALMPAEAYGSTMEVDFTVYRELSYLARSYAIAILPSASALIVGRGGGPTNTAPEPFFALGDPAFLGAASPAPVRLEEVQDGPEVDYAELFKRLGRLPHTRSEVLAIAAAFDVPEGALLLGEDANESRLKAHDLDRYQVLSFATHALTAGSFAGLLEPALALSPPIAVSSDDDGLLTPKEIVQLRLNADWVLLSACNTAAPSGRPGAEGLSGLAKAFFYAGARSLLVSHWAVPSASTAQLMIGATTAMAGSQELSHAKAVQAAMLALIDDPANPVLAHPRFWAPFIVVGGV